MKEYAWHLNVYSDKWHLAYNRTLNSHLWGDMIAAEKYLQKYWLSLEEYEKIWKPIQESIFTHADSLPELVFKNSYTFIALEGGVLFYQKEYEAFQRCLLAIGESHFVIVQNNFNGQFKEPPFRLKFPSSITWEEIKEGNFIFTALFEIPHNDYYIFGASNAWGRYSANDYEYPLSILGFKSDYSSVFTHYLSPSQRQWKKIKSWIPPQYKSKIMRPTHLEKKLHEKNEYHNKQYCC